MFIPRYTPAKSRFSIFTHIIFTSIAKRTIRYYSAALPVLPDVQYTVPVLPERIILNY